MCAFFSYIFKHALALTAISKTPQPRQALNLVFKILQAAAESLRQQIANRCLLAALHHGFDVGRSGCKCLG